VARPPTRRQGNALLLGTWLVALAAAGCGGDERSATTPISTTERARSATSTQQAGFEERFAHFEPAPEPDGDLAKVVWPDYVLQAPPEVRELYEFQVTNGELTRYIPCFCGCGASSGHRNNRDCYVRRVNAAGSVVFDPMAPT
jgi:hypothetical protein